MKHVFQDEYDDLGNDLSGKQQGEPVAWMSNKDGSILRINAAHGDYTIPLFTHADPAEVERLRADVETMRRKNNEYWHENEALRAQLAERGDLLEEALGSVYVDAGCCESGAVHSDLVELAERIKVNLSARAETKQS